MKTSEVLNKAADLIEERGWTQGNPGWGSYGTGRLCLEGGVVAALGWNMTATTAANTAFLEGTCPAYEAVKAYLDPSTYRASLFGGDAERLWVWNDAPGRTASEVVEVLRACALIEAAREEQDAAWETYAEVVTA